MPDEAALIAAVLENAGALIVVLDREGRIVRFNRAAEQLSGYDFEEVRGKFPWETVLPPKVARTVEPGAFEALLDGGAGGVARFTNEWVSRAGQRYTIEWSNTVLRSGGEATHLVSVGTDVTERIRAQEALEQSQRTLRTLLDALPAFVSFFDTDGVCIETNQLPLEAGGLTREDLIGQYFPDTVFWSHSEAMRERLADSIVRARRGEIVREDVTAQLGDGTLVDLDAIMSPVVDDEGRVTHLVGVGLDVTERREMEAALRRSETQLNEAQRIAGLGSWELDLGSGELQWSDQVYALFDIDPDRFEPSYEAFLDRIHPEDREQVDLHFQASVDAGEPYQVQHRIVLPDGEVRWVEERGETEREPSGAPVRSRGTVLDITEAREREAQLEQALAERETLLREVHHRVKNNLQVISSFLYFQRVRAGDSEEAGSLAETDQRLHAMALVHETLYQAGSLARIDLGAYIQKLSTHLLQTVHSPGPLTTRVEVAAVEVSVETAMPTGMLLTELVSNVGKYAFVSERPGRLELLLEREPGFAVLRVVDDGVGLPEDFDPDESGGFGWRLVRKLAEQLEAAVSLEEGPGTRVRVRIPVPDQASRPVPR